MFTQKDLIQVKNLKSLLKKAKVELQGEEILAAAEVLMWVGTISQKIEENLKQQEYKAKISLGTDKTSGPELPSQPESLPEKPKKSKK